MFVYLLFLYRENTLYINTLCEQTKDQNVKFTCMNNERSHCGYTRFPQCKVEAFYNIMSIVLSTILDVLPHSLNSVEEILNCFIVYLDASIHSMVTVLFICGSTRFICVHTVKTRFLTHM